ncbi:glycosyltransferase family 4 protein [Kitasatospora sp. NPDC089509]|uniref:glycosyltransferase family 4 protein n=1 Tax=Kitasatospora sp. NPDC089509 TaxID=3364079 RepID=UPI003813749B
MTTTRSELQARHAPRVLLLTSGYAPTIGGAETYAQTLSEGLARSGCPVAVVTDRPPGTAPVPGDTDVRIHRLDGYRALLTDPSKLAWEQLYFGLLPELHEIVEAFRPEVVVVNNLETTVLGRIVAEQYGIGIVAAYHEHAPEEEPLGPGKEALGYRVLAPDLVLAGSEYYAQRARRHLPEHRVRLIHHGVETEHFHPSVDGSAVRARYGVTAGERLIVSAGRLKARKGQRELIHAFARLADERSRLLIVGGVSSASPQYAQRLEADVDRLGLRGRIIIDRSVGYDQMPAVYAAADIVAQPSESEGLGLAVLEAMSTARPVVTTDVPGIREILTADGIAECVPARDPVRLAGALARLLSDPPHAARVGEAARRHVLEHFSTDSMIRRSRAAIEEVVAGAPR